MKNKDQIFKKLNDIKNGLNKSKFKIGEIVYINVTAKSKSHFVTNVFGVIEYNYSTRYGVENYNLYGIYILDENPSTRAWYEVSELTLASTYEVTSLKRDGLIPKDY